MGVPAYGGAATSMFTPASNGVGIQNGLVARFPYSGPPNDNLYSQDVLGVQGDSLNNGYNVQEQPMNQQVPSQPIPAQTTPNGVVPKGTTPNETTPNGTMQNGTAPNGTSPNGTTPNGAMPNAAPGAATPAAANMPYPHGWAFTTASASKARKPSLVRSAELSNSLTQIARDKRMLAGKRIDVLMYGDVAIIQGTVHSYGDSTALANVLSLEPKVNRIDNRLQTEGNSASSATPQNH
jgi:hypothetical protein